MRTKEESEKLVEKWSSILEMTGSGLNTAIIIESQEKQLFDDDDVYTYNAHCNSGAPTIITPKAV